MTALALAAIALAAPPKSHIVWKPIPYGAARRAEMAAYAAKHYGMRTCVLHPHAIVEHVTATNSFTSVYDTSAADLYRGKLAAFAATYRFAVGPTFRPRPTGC